MLKTNFQLHLEVTPNANYSLVVFKPMCYIRIKNACNIPRRMQLSKIFIVYITSPPKYPLSTRKCHAFTYWQLQKTSRIIKKNARCDIHCTFAAIHTAPNKISRFSIIMEWKRLDIVMIKRPILHVAIHISLQFKFFFIIPLPKRNAKEQVEKELL